MIAALAPSQTLAWASSNYLVAIVADSIARDLSTSTTAFTLLVRGSRDLCSVAIRQHLASFNLSTPHANTQCGAY